MKTMQKVGKNLFMTSDGYKTFSSQYIDENGEAIERTPSEYPYSYDGYVTHRMGENKDANATVYCDRLWQQDYDKYNRLSKKHFGNEAQMFYDREPKKIEAFLRDWMDSPKLKLILVMQYCNVSSGYPVWRFDYKTNS